MHNNMGDELGRLTWWGGGVLGGGVGANNFPRGVDGTSRRDTRIPSARGYFYCGKGIHVWLEKKLM
jgi:hypothetical protein